jgi:hypothetical protein
MAKTDSFFIRKTINIQDDLSYYETSIDLGAYVDALGKAVLRVLNIAVSYSDSTGRTPSLTGSTNGTSASADFQLATQTQADMVVPGNNKSIVASGRLSCYSFGTTGTVFPSIVSNDMDVAPQHWTNGYLIGVEQLYIGGAATTGWQEDIYVSIVMECTSETLTKEAAMALALSQQ